MPPAAESDLVLALLLADAADAVSMRHFTGRPVAAETKSDGSPVTETDRAVERRVAEILASERPGDGILGEEIGASGPTGRRWIVDGIDGTVLFVRGQRAWATEIALEVDGELAVGVSTSPAVGARWWASRGGGAWRTGPVPGVTPRDVAGAPRRLHVSDGVGDGDGRGPRVTVIPPLAALRGDERDLGERLAGAGRYVQPVVHGALLVTEGVADACLQPSGGSWDFAAIALIVEEAGGRFSDLAGRHDVHGGGPVLYSNGRVHDAVLAALRPGPA
ncbi:MAG TPA: inositol monophosphatase family protein [Acidimicrobiales bacterium]|nr:inositol monophosphatase family protein [Acidimicrobiales bacterium]